MRTTLGIGLALLLMGCPSSGDDATEAAPSTTSSPAATTTAPPTTEVMRTPASTATTSPTTLDPQLACLAEALGSHPELLGILGETDANPVDRLRALLVARTCLPAEQVRTALLEGLRDAVPEALSDFQMTCLGDLVLDLPDDELATLLAVTANSDTSTTSGGRTRAEIAARLLDLCGVEPA